MFATIKLRKWESYRLRTFSKKSKLNSEVPAAFS
jgi:hypothetical protein